MTVTYRLTNTNSDLSGGQDYNKAILDPGSDTTGTTNVSLAASETRNSFGFTAAGDPGADGAAGDYVVEMEVITGDTNVQLSCAVARINSAGTQQAISAFATEQAASAGVHTFNFTNPSLGTWATGDRLRVTFRHRNSHTHTARSISVNHGGTNNEVVAPFASGGTTIEGQAAGAYTYSGTAAGGVTVVGSAAGAYSYTGTAAGVESTPPVEGSAAGAYAYAGTAAGVEEPTRPTGLTAQTVSASQIDLDWDAFPDATGYDVERDSLIIAMDVATNSYEDTGLDPDTLYTYRVRAVMS
jgi:hypothetical protein